MTRFLVTSLVLTAVALGVWQMSDGTPAAYAHHTGNTYNCEDFTTQAAAQAHYRLHPGDQDNLDADKDGVACENLFHVPCPCDFVPISGFVFSPIFHGGPVPSRPSHLSLQVQQTSISCNAETSVIARVTYANGVGAPAHLVTFQSSLGTVFTNILTDGLGYVTTKFVAPHIPSTIQLTAFADGLTQIQTIHVTCPQPQPPIRQTPLLPPSTGDGGLAGNTGGNGSFWLLLGAFLLVASTPVAVLAVARQRR